MKSGQHTEIDYEAVAEKWFGQREPADKLRSAIQDMARQTHDSANYGTPSQRKTKLRSAASWGAKLKTLLSEMDPPTRVQLFGAGEVGSSAGENELVFKVRPAQNADALSIGKAKPGSNRAEILKHLVDNEAAPSALVMVVQKI
jgi:hypothetical protein